LLQRPRQPLAGPGLASVDVGQHPSAVDTQLRKVRDLQINRQLDHLPKGGPQWLAVLASRFAERRVVDLPARRESHEVDRVLQLIFHLPAAADAPDHGKQQRLGQHAGVDRWLMLARAGASENEALTKCVRPVSARFVIRRKTPAVKSLVIPYNFPTRHVGRISMCVGLQAAIRL
jgi:hypothetical protein